MIDLIHRFWDILERREQVRTLLALCVLLASSFVQMLGVGSVLPLMAVLSRPEIIQSNRWLHALYTFFGFTSEHHFLFFLGVSSLLAVLLSNACLALNQWVSVHLWASIQRRLEYSLLDKYLHAPYVIHLRRSPAELKRNVLDETLRFSSIISLTLQLAASGFVILCITALLLAINPLLSLVIALSLGGGYGLVYLRVRHYTEKIGVARIEANLERYRMVDEGLAGLKELRLLQRTPWIMERFNSATEVLSDTLAKLSVVGTLPRYFIEVVGVGSLVFVVLYLLARHSDVRDAIPLLSVFAFGAYRMLPAMQGAYKSIMGLRFLAPVGLAIERELRDSVQTDVPEKKVNEARGIRIFQNAIELTGVGFSFSTDRGRVLRDISVKIPCQAFVGFVGETGAGKSTLADVILGLLPPETGKILVDGVPLRGNATRRWQRLLGYVPQDIYLADDTIENNIAFGLPPGEVDADAVRNAARLAQIHDFIEGELPEGYRTVVGDRGVRLSGGQRQRIGIARALYHGPEVLILDEATSMLDGETERRVFSAIESLAHEITLIVIAHRLTTIRQADTIYLLEQGRVTAQGTFSELLQSSEQFKNMAHGLAH